jgi:hypothetical protein
VRLGGKANGWPICHSVLLALDLRAVFLSMVHYPFSTLVSQSLASRRVRPGILDQLRCYLSGKGGGRTTVNSEC